MNALNKNTSFLRHYIKLEKLITTPDDCFIHHKNIYERQARQKIHEKHSIDKDSILGTYLTVNPNLSCPKMYHDICCNENDRKIITKYRVGSHMLKIQSERLSANSDRANRLCQCNLDIQTLAHVIFQCPLTEHIRVTHNLQNDDLTSFFNGNDLVKTAICLKAIEKLVI